MKLKYLLASGLFLSTAFVACTNDDFAEISAPVANTEDAIALGEGFTIKVNKGGVDTRSAFNENLSPYWEELDTLGAAWVHMVTGFNEQTLMVNPDGCSTIGSDYGMLYSNAPFALVEGANTNAGTFETFGNVFAGAYVLYYPYDHTVAKTGREIPVGIKTYTSDLENPLKNISENMFSYSPVKFVPGGPRTSEFSLEQIPVLVELKFMATDELNMNLRGGIAINNIVVEAKKDGRNVLVSKGHIVTDQVPTVDDYNGTNGGNLNDIVKYEKTENCENLFITLENNTGDEFKLMKENVYTEGSFIFSMLPLEEAADEVTIKVVTDRDVYATTYTASQDAEKLAAFNGTANEPGAAYEGGQVRMRVDLDVTEEDNVIYTAKEFLSRWNEACQTNATSTNENVQKLKIGTDLTLEEGLVCSNSNYSPNIIVEGNYKLTVPSITVTKSYGVTFEGVDLIVEGNVKSTGASSFTADKLTAKEIEIEGQGDVTVAKAEKLTVTSSAIVTVAGVDDQSTIGEIVIEESQGAQGSLTYNGDLNVNTLTSAATGKLVLNADFTNAADQTMTIGGLVLGKGHTLTNNGTMTLITNYNGSESTSKIVNNGELNVKADYEKINLTNKGMLNVYGTLKASDNNTYYPYIVNNEGIIYVYGKLEEVKDQAMTSIGNVFARTETAKIQFPNSNNTKWAGYVFILNNKNVVRGTGEKLSYQLNSATDASKVNDNASGANYVFVNADVTSEDLVNSKLNDKNLIFQKNLTLTSDMTANFNFQVMGNVTISGNGHTLTLSNAEDGDKENKVWPGATLTINGGVILKGENTFANRSVLDVYGRIVNNGKIETETLNVVQH